MDDPRAAEKALEAVPDGVLELHTEYLYRHDVMPGLTHDEYLDEPGDVIQWMTRIHALYQERQRRQQAAAS